MDRQPYAPIWRFWSAIKTVILVGRARLGSHMSDRARIDRSERMEFIGSRLHQALLEGPLISHTST